VIWLTASVQLLLLFAVSAAGFQLRAPRQVSGWLLPMILLQATRAEEDATQL
jgi:hypothetical protein